MLGGTSQLVDIAHRKRVARALITIANASGTDIRRITMQCREAGLDTKIIPGIYEIVGDRVNLSRIRDVAIEDFLGDRAPISQPLRWVQGRARLIPREDSVPGRAIGPPKERTRKRTSRAWVRSRPHHESDAAGG